MGTTAELVIPAPEFALARSLDRVPSLEVRIEPVVASATDSIMPHVGFRADRESLATLDDHLEADPTVVGFKRLANGDDERRYLIQWADSVIETVNRLTATKAAILDAFGTGAQWHLRVLVPERDVLSATYDAATEAGLTIDVARVHELELTERSRYGLTDAQYETLVTALAAGYYEIPRNVDMEGLAAELDISHQALSERLRRAHRRLVTESLDVDRSPSE
ncbi:bacterio-opsin activator HTH domain-containing protein [Halovivax asiaticus JCM 14624]|uniref:Bacterio-opsin activator HTH domain-containing protein n=1 Tax=Halovivax asiaticus JCM 14624 TaxID=1227490 RepID=M0B8D4_9EURY|nr:helix-turn-helix domain-containing protein [Halovivax asiaticus]ELZ07055.1 bacterio-opsin activator HTH domain-containing protein [Halovivax asiaticus JCM 14624]